MLLRADITSTRGDVVEKGAMKTFAEPELNAYAGAGANEPLRRLGGKFFRV